MSPWTAILLVLAPFALIAGAHWWSARRWPLVVDELASRWALEVIRGPDSLCSATAQRGRLSVQVCVDMVGADEEHSSQWTRVTVITPLSGQLTLERRRVSGLIGGQADRPGFATGIRELDHVIEVGGRVESEALAFLDARTRQALEAAIAGQGATLYSDGSLMWQRRGIVTRPTVLNAVVRDLLRLGEQLAGGMSDPTERLADHVEGDSDPAFRRRCLEVLHWESRTTTAAWRALHAGGRDDDPEVRLTAAVFRGDVDTLLDTTTLRALANAESPGIRAMTARALALQSAPDEPLLLRLLDDGALSVKLAAVSALSEVGSVDAVMPLRQAGSGVTTPGTLRTACQRAIASIRARGSGETGSLSLTSDSAHIGRVSVSEPED